VLTVNRLRDAYSTWPDPRAVPDPPWGSTRFVAVYITLANEGGTPLAYTRLDFNMQDSQGGEHEVAAPPDLDPALTAGTLDPGAQVSGWMSFQVPIDARLVALVYHPPVETAPLRAALPAATR